MKRFIFSLGNAELTKNLKKDYVRRWKFLRKMIDMPTYKPFPCNSEVIDVFSCVVDGKNTVKIIIKTLRQPQSTVSEKLRFLVKNNIIIKDKWKFRPNWNLITELFQKQIKLYFEGQLSDNFMLYAFEKMEGKTGNEKAIEKIKDIINNLHKIFDKKRVSKILMVYADYLNEGWLKKMSLDELANTYIGVIKNIEINKLKKLDRKLLKIRNVLDDVGFKEISMEEDMFMLVEKYGEYIKS